MEERYVIKDKIGHGGLGTIYRAKDLRMNREVAIKRIVTNTEDATISEQATRQLMQEASSLACLQHPNIVTVYDVGSDKDGPYVVMELLSGDTLEDIIGKASFTWVDFREFAKQTMEALIAAQELNMVHRDLKPSNIMLTWLPSGKFQVKIVDFGLSKLTSQPSLQTIDQSNGVFGSIYFMAPEQFERVPIDLKVDLYAIGCVYYYALTGNYPFDSDSAAGVMAAHLQNYVTPLNEVREGIPLWVCEWVMWHINRQASDRPASARESLRVFIENDEQTSPVLSTGIPAVATAQPMRPRLAIPGAATEPEFVKEVSMTQHLKTASVPKPLLPPAGSKPSVHITAQVLQSAQRVAVVPEDQATPPPAINAIATPSPVVIQKAIPILEAVKPTLTIKQPAALPVVPLAANSHSTTRLTPTVLRTKVPSALPVAVDSKKKGLSSGVKTLIAAVIVIFAVVLVLFLQ